MKRPKSSALTAREADATFDVYFGIYSFLQSTPTAENSVLLTWSALFARELLDECAKILWSVAAPRVYLTSYQPLSREDERVTLMRLELPESSVPGDAYILLGLLLNLSRRPQWASLSISARDADGDILALYCDRAPSAGGERNSPTDGRPECILRAGQVYKCGGANQRLDRATASQLPCDMSVLEQRLRKCQDHNCAAVRKLSGHHHVPVVVNKQVLEMLRTSPNLAAAALNLFWTSEFNEHGKTDTRFTLPPKSSDGGSVIVPLPTACIARLVTSAKKRIPGPYSLKNWGGIAHGDEAARLLGGMLSLGIELMQKNLLVEASPSLLSPLVGEKEVERSKTLLLSLFTKTFDELEVLLYDRISGGVERVEVDRETAFRRVTESTASALAPYVALLPMADSLERLLSTQIIDRSTALKCFPAELVSEDSRTEALSGGSCPFQLCNGAESSYLRVDAELSQPELAEAFDAVAGPDAEGVAKLLGLEAEIDAEELAAKLGAGLGIESDLFDGVQFSNSTQKPLMPEEEAELKAALAALGLDRLLSDSDSGTEDFGTEEEGVRGEEDFDDLFREQLELLVKKTDENDDAVIRAMHGEVSARDILFSELKSG